MKEPIPKCNSNMGDIANARATIARPAGRCDKLQRFPVPVHRPGLVARVGCPSLYLMKRFGNVR
jgi:hypothetical protein